MSLSRRPDPSEYAEYYHRYISLVPDGDIVVLLEGQIADTVALIGGLSEESAGRPYAPGKWSVKQVVGHLADSERVFAYRAMRIARGDRTFLPGFEQDDYVREGGFDDRPLQDLLEEFQAVRRATVALVGSLTAEAAARTGMANNFGVSVRALAWIAAGHERHHQGLIREKYL